MRISIIGLGWYGEPLAKTLLKDGHAVSGTTRSHEKKSFFDSQNIKTSILNHPDRPSDTLLNADIIVLNVPPFAKELDWFKSWKWNPETWMIFISSTSGKPEIIEQENWIQSHFKDWTILRFGGLIGNGRHPGKHLSGKKNLPGRFWPVNLIHQDDAVGVTKTIINQKIKNKILNVVSDEHPTREEFYTKYCRDHSLSSPEFDMGDSSAGNPISNDELKSFYSSFKKLS